jgi:hypothetical protein
MGIRRRVRSRARAPLARIGRSLRIGRSYYSGEPGGSGSAIAVSSSPASSRRRSSAVPRISSFARALRMCVRTVSSERPRSRAIPPSVPPARKARRMTRSVAVRFFGDSPPKRGSFGPGPGTGAARYAGGMREHPQYVSPFVSTSRRIVSCDDDHRYTSSALIVEAQDQLRPAERVIDGSSRRTSRSRRGSSARRSANPKRGRAASSSICPCASRRRRS